MDVRKGVSRGLKNARFMQDRRMNVHFVELFVDLGVVFVILDQLDDQRSVGQRKELRILFMERCARRHNRRGH